MNWTELDLDSNQGRENRSDLRRLAEALDSAADNDPWRSISRLVDIDNFTRFIALEQLVNHWDGYTQVNNYRMYHNPDTLRFEIIPHGCDQLFEESGADIFRPQGGILSRALVGTDSGLQRYRETMQGVLDQIWDGAALRDRIAATYRLIRPHVEALSDSGHEIEEFEHNVSRVLRFIAVRRYAVLAQLEASAGDRSWREPREFHFHSFLHHGHDDWE